MVTIRGITPNQDLRAKWLSLLAVANIEGSIAAPNLSDGGNTSLLRLIELVEVLAEILAILIQSVIAVVLTLAISDVLVVRVMLPRVQLRKETASVGIGAATSARLRNEGGNQRIATSIKDRVVNDTRLGTVL